MQRDCKLNKSKMQRQPREPGNNKSDSRNKPQAPAQDSKPPNTASKVWIKDQDARLELVAITPCIVEKVAEIRRLVNIEIDARIAHKKNSQKLEKIRTSAAKKVKERFFLRSTGEWQERERESTSSADLLVKLRMLGEVLDKDAETARTCADQTASQLIESIKSRRSSTTFTGAEIEKMPRVLSLAIKAVTDRDKRERDRDLAESGDEEVNAVADWYAKIIKTAKDLVQKGVNDLEKMEAERKAREQAAAANAELNADGEQMVVPARAQHRSEQRFMPARGGGKPRGRGGQRN